MLKRKESRGLATAVGLTVMLIVVILTFAITAISLENLNTMTRDDGRRRAVYAAESGLNDSLASLKANMAWNAGFTAKTMPNNQTDSYTVHVGNNSAGGALDHPFDATQVPAGKVYLRSDGFHEGSGSSRYVSKTETAFVDITSPVGTFALFGDQSITLAGAGYIDAWDSSLGAYTPHPPPWVLPGTANMNAPIGTNGTASGSLQANVAEYVDGYVQIGPSGSTGILDPTFLSQVTGGAAVAKAPYPMPQVTDPLLGAVSGGDQATSTEIPDVVLVPGRYGSLGASSGSVTLSSGVYSFSSVNMSTATLTINSASGPVIVYLEGNWNTTQTKIVNSSLRPANFQIYGTDATTAMTLMPPPLAGGQYAVVYAPNAAIMIPVTADSDFFGSMVGKSISQTTGVAANFHFDLSLKNVRTVPVLRLSNRARL